MLIIYSICVKIYFIIRWVCIYKFCGFGRFGMYRFEEKVWLSSPTMHGDEMRYMKEAFDSNWMSTVGENINELEGIACEKTGCRYAVALSCGTAALHLAIKLAGVNVGDRVFCSDLTFAATANPILYEKAEPVFIDSEYESWNMDPKALEKAFEIYPDTKVVVVAHLYGTPANMDEICRIAEKYNAVVIEDAAESFGATYNGKQTGSLGKFNVISFNGNKIITGSSGGMLLTDDLKASQLARKWSTQSRENAPWYQHEYVGYNYRMSNVIAGVVRGQMPYLTEHIKRKKEIYERYKKAFSDLPVSMNHYSKENCEPNFWLSCMIINKDAMCEQSRTESKACFTSQKGKSCPTEILEKLEEYNAEGRPIWKPMHMQPIYKNCDFITVNGNVCEDIFERGLCLPSDIKMTNEQQDNIIKIVKSCFK